VANRTVAPRLRKAGPARNAKTAPADALDLRLAGAQRGLLSVVVVLAGVVIWRPLLDPFMLPRLTVIVLGAVGLLGLAGARAVRHGRVSLPVGLPIWIVAALAAALVLATVTADDVLISLIGQHSRYGGLLSYAAYLAVFLVAVRLYRATPPRGLLIGSLVALAAVTVYGLVQVAGLDPFTWASRLDEPVFSTLGNTNFAAAYVAMLLPVAGTVAVFRGWNRGWRTTAGVLLLLGLVYVLATRATQGVLGAAGGLGLVAVAWVLSRRASGPGRVPSGGGARRWLPFVGAALALVLVGLAGVVLAPEIRGSLGERLQFWQAALGVFVDHPVLGTGLDSFRDYFLRYRPAEHAVLRNFQGTDSTHNLPLGMLTNGGLPLAAAYLAFVGCTGWTLLRGLRSVSRERMPELAAFGGMWVAYQIQSLVSLDVPAVTLLHFVSAALIIAIVSPPGAKGLRLPVATTMTGSWLPRPTADRRPTVAVLAGLVVVVLATAWYGALPLRADVAASQARGTKGAEALPDLDRAVELAPWEAEYRLLQAQARLDAGDEAGAYAAAITAAELRRGSSKLALGNADLASSVGDDEAVQRWVTVALERDPRNPTVYERAAELARKDGRSRVAETLDARADELRATYGDR
jgi:putative inorganic carbon (HCO3(-)) transporter